MLDVKALTRAYGDFKAVDDVSFTIADGEIVGLLGHNGAGKTTIMKMLSGYLEPDNGDIRIDGQSLPEDSIQICRHLGYLPENLPVYQDMSVIDYLDYVATLKQLHGQTRTDAVRRVIADTEINDRLLDTIGTLSRGLRQRVGVAQALLGSPRLLILDEPTNGLDPTQTEHMRRLIRRIAKSATVILSTHIMQEVEALCDRVLIINQGRLITDASLASLRTSHTLQLRCSLTFEQLQNLCVSLPGFTTVTELQFNTFRLELKAGNDLDQSAAMLAQELIRSGAQLFSLTAETRNLESLFHDAVAHHPASSKEGSTDAV